MTRTARDTSDPASRFWSSVFWITAASIVAGSFLLWHRLGRVPADKAREEQKQVDERARESRASNDDSGPESSPLADAGIYGDSFGAVNSLASMLACAGVLIAVLYQAKVHRETLGEFARDRRLNAELANTAAKINGLSSLLGTSQVMMRDALGRWERAISDKNTEHIKNSKENFKAYEKCYFMTMDDLIKQLNKCDINIDIGSIVAAEPPDVRERGGGTKPDDAHP